MVEAQFEDHADSNCYFNGILMVLSFTFPCCFADFHGQHYIVIVTYG
jgi:hypothetical protein